MDNDIRMTEPHIIIWDRMRTVNYNGSEEYMNTYQCSECEERWISNRLGSGGGPHDNHPWIAYCPICGYSHKETEDVSI